MFWRDGWPEAPPRFVRHNVLKGTCSRGGYGRRVISINYLIGRRESEDPRRDESDEYVCL